jgi:hypothetical protein
LNFLHYAENNQVIPKSPSLVLAVHPDVKPENDKYKLPANTDGLTAGSKHPFVAD